jgi:hypothetical protein
MKFTDFMDFSKISIKKHLFFGLKIFKKLRKITLADFAELRKFGS